LELTFLQDKIRYFVTASPYTQEDWPGPAKKGMPEMGRTGTEPIMIDSTPAILVIEDDADLRRSIALWLTETGYIALEAGDGQEGLARIREKRPDAVLLDLRLPVLDGFGVLTALAAEKDVTPAIIISGLDEIQGGNRAFRKGAAG